jgi:hypothetical protein
MKMERHQSFTCALSLDVDHKIKLLWWLTGCVALACFRLPQFSMLHFWTGCNHETGFELMTKQLSVPAAALSSLAVFSLEGNLQ